MDDLFDFDGSTRIIVTYNATRVIGTVSPYAMALASPVWRKFLFPPFPQTKNLDGPEDGGRHTPVQKDDRQSGPTRLEVMI
jgi:hypothetical protein